MSLIVSLERLAHDIRPLLTLLDDHLNVKYLNKTY